MAGRVRAAVQKIIPVADSADNPAPQLPHPPAAKPLAIPRRDPRLMLERSEAAAEARKSIHAIRSATRDPFGRAKTLETSELDELERTLRQLETSLMEREHAAQEWETRLAERERDLWEAEALLAAREKLTEVARRPHAGQAVSPEEQAALEQFKAALEQQETSLKAAKAEIREREAFLAESENTLFAKVQAEQERETELEQREEELQTREKRLRLREAAVDPAVAAALQAEQAAPRKTDEFNE